MVPLRAATLALLGVCAAAPALANLPPPAVLAGGCSGCHGAAGQGANGVPAIQRTKTRAEFAAAMQEFRENRRENTIMGRVARGYTPDEIAALAAHFARPE